MTAKLAAAFPRDWGGETTKRVYVQRLMRLGSYEAAVVAVDASIDSSFKLPTIASIREGYAAALERLREPRLALPEPELSDEEREENVRRLRELAVRLSAGLPEVTPPEPRTPFYANAVLADGPGRGTHLTLDGEAVIHVPLPDPRIDARALAAEFAGVDDPAERRRLARARRRSAVYERTDTRVAGVTHYRFRDWVPDEEEESGGRPA